MNWRYQPVYKSDAAGSAVTLCECYFNKEGKIRRWTESAAMEPLGATIEELQQDLIRMLVDSYKWEPVAFDSLHVGMTFQRTGVDVEGMLNAMNMARGALGP